MEQLITMSEGQMESGVRHTTRHTTGHEWQRWVYNAVNAQIKDD